MVRRALDLVTLFFGFVTLIAVLAVVASIPVLKLVTLGYLLQAEGRVARTGRLRGALPGLRPLARLGGAVLGALVVATPWLIVSDLRHDALLIDPASRAARNMTIAQLVLGGATALHAALALLRGGRLRFFFRPFANLRWALARARSGEPLGAERLGPWLRSLELGRYFVLGLKGFVAALAWIALPTALLAVSWHAPPVALLGGFLL